MRTKFWLESLEGRDHEEDLGVDGRIILKWLFMKRRKGVNWIHVVQDGDRWRDQHTN
jgi:hypothetical protein